MNSKNTIKSPWNHHFPMVFLYFFPMKSPFPWHFPWHFPMRGATAHATGGVGQLGLDAPGTLAVPAAGPSGLRCGDLPWQIGVGRLVKPLKICYFQGLCLFTRGCVEIYIYNIDKYNIIYGYRYNIYICVCVSLNLPKCLYVYVYLCVCDVFFMCPRWNPSHRRIWRVTWIRRWELWGKQREFEGFDKALGIWLKMT